MLLLLLLDNDALFLDQGRTFFDDTHFVIDVVALHSSKALDHAAAELEIHPSARVFVFGD